MIYIIRHGQTDKNIGMKLQGRTDTPLNATGVAQAGEAAEYFKKNGIAFDRIYSSPLSRALDTARIVSGGSPEPVIDERLTEIDYGPYEGVDIGNPPPDVVLFLRDCINNPAPEGIEPLAHIMVRAGDFLESLDPLPGENILISTHAIAMKGLLEYLTPGSEGSYWVKYIGNCCIYRTDYMNGTFSVPEEVVNPKPF